MKKLSVIAAALLLSTGVGLAQTSGAAPDSLHHAPPAAEASPGDAANPPSQPSAPAAGAATTSAEAHAMMMQSQMHTMMQDMMQMMQMMQDMKAMMESMVRDGGGGPHASMRGALPLESDAHGSDGHVMQMLMMMHMMMHEHGN